MSSIKPINPERRDPGIIRKKADVGLSNVDNLNTTDYINIILSLVKDNINKDDRHDLFVESEDTNDDLKIGICQLGAESSCATITFGLLSSSGRVLETLRLELVYTANPRNISLPGTVEYQTIVTGDGRYFLNSKILFYESRSNSFCKCNVILDLPKTLISGDNKINELGINIFEYTRDVKKLDSTKINDVSMYDSFYGFTLIEEILCDKSRSSFRDNDEILQGLPVYDNKTNLQIEIHKGDNIEDESYLSNDYPTINDIPFIAYKDVTINNVSGRNVTIPAKHKSLDKYNSGTHSWNVLDSFPSVGLVDSDEDSYNSLSYQSNSSGYGLCKLSGYNKEIKSRALNDLTEWINSLSNDNSDVVPVGAFKVFANFLASAITSSSDKSKTIYQLEFKDSSNSYTMSLYNGSTYKYTIYSKRIVYNSSSTVEEYRSNLEYEVKYLDTVSGIEITPDSEWITNVQITKPVENTISELSFTTSPNLDEFSRRAIIVLTQVDSDKTLSLLIDQSSSKDSSVSYGFVINGNFIKQNENYIYPEILNNEENSNIKIQVSRPISIDEFGIEKKFADYQYFTVENDWIQLDEDSQTNPSTDNYKGYINFSLQENNTSIQRTGKILCTSGKPGGEGSNFSSIILLKQEAGEYSINISPESIQVNKNGFISESTSPTLTINANSNWNLYESVSWIYSNKINGGSGDNQKITLTVEKNNTIIERICDLIFKCGTIEKIVKVTQEAGDRYLIINNSSEGDFYLSFLAEGGYKYKNTATIKCNDSWEISETTLPDWVSVSKLSGGESELETETELIFITTTNTSQVDRRGTVTLTSGNLTRNIIIEQGSANTINIIPQTEELNFGWNDIESNGIRKQVYVLSNTIYDIKPMQSWISCSKDMAGSSNKDNSLSSFYVSITEQNRQSTSRVGTITLSERDSTDPVEETITINQEGYLYLSGLPSTITVGSKASNSEKISLDTNATKIVVQILEEVEWLEITSTSENTKEIIFKVTANSTTQSRKTRIQIHATADDPSLGAIDKTVEIIQEAGSEEVSKKIVGLKINPSITDLLPAPSSGTGVVTFEVFGTFEVTTYVGGIVSKVDTVLENISSDENLILKLDSDSSFPENYTKPTFSKNIMTYYENNTDQDINFSVIGSYSTNTSTGSSTKTDTVEFIQRQKGTVTFYTYDNFKVQFISGNNFSYSGGKNEIKLIADVNTYVVKDGDEDISPTKTEKGKDISSISSELAQITLTLTQQPRTYKSSSLYAYPFSITLSENYNAEDNISGKLSATLKYLYRGDIINDGSQETKTLNASVTLTQSNPSPSFEIESLESNTGTLRLDGKAKTTSKFRVKSNIKWTLYCDKLHSDSEGRFPEYIVSIDEGWNGSYTNGNWVEGTIKLRGKSINITNSIQTLNPLYIEGVNGDYGKKSLSITNNYGYYINIDNTNISIGSEKGSTSNIGLLVYGEEWEIISGEHNADTDDFIEFEQTQGSSNIGTMPNTFKNLKITAKKENITVLPVSKTYTAQVRLPETINESNVLSKQFTITQSSPGTSIEVRGLGAPAEIGGRKDSKIEFEVKSNVDWTLFAKEVSDNILLRFPEYDVAIESKYSKGHSYDGVPTEGNWAKVTMTIREDHLNFTKTKLSLNSLNIASSDFRITKDYNIIEGYGYYFEARIVDNIFDSTDTHTSKVGYFEILSYGASEIEVTGTGTNLWINSTIGTSNKGFTYNSYEDLGIMPDEFVGIEDFTFGPMTENSSEKEISNTLNIVYYPEDDITISGFESEYEFTIKQYSKPKITLTTTNDSYLCNPGYTVLHWKNYTNVLNTGYSLPFMYVKSNYNNLKVTSEDNRLGFIDKSLLSYPNSGSSSLNLTSSSIISGGNGFGFYVCCANDLQSTTEYLSLFTSTKRILTNYKLKLSTENTNNGELAEEEYPVYLEIPYTIRELRKEEYYLANGDFAVPSGNLELNGITRQVGVEGGWITSGVNFDLTHSNQTQQISFYSNIYMNNIFGQLTEINIYTYDSSSNIYRKDGGITLYPTIEFNEGTYVTFDSTKNISFSVPSRYNNTMVLANNIVLKIKDEEVFNNPNFMGYYYGIIEIKASRPTSEDFGTVNNNILQSLITNNPCLIGFRA